jgi:hypothetical protein
MVVIGTFGTVKLALLELLDQPDPAKKLDQNRQILAHRTNADPVAEEDAPNQKVRTTLPAPPLR